MVKGTAFDRWTIGQGNVRPLKHEKRQRLWIECRALSCNLRHHDFGKSAVSHYQRRQPVPAPTNQNQEALTATLHWQIQPGE
jgi:hypothetical protein